MARRKKSSRKRRSDRRKRRTTKAVKTSAVPVTLPPFGWNIDDQSANQIARRYAERQRQQNVAGQLGGQGNLIADLAPRRGPLTVNAEILKHTRSRTHKTSSMSAAPRKRPNYCGAAK